MAESNYLVCSYSEDSHRHSILEYDGRTGIVYLHAPSDDPEHPGQVEATCFAFNRVDPIEPSDVARYSPDPPPIAQGYASKVAVCRWPTAEAWEIVWSLDGETVVLLRNSNPWAIVSLAQPRGLSRAIEMTGPWGHPWSDEAYYVIALGGRARRCS
jgi:hypothetical protein